MFHHPERLTIDSETGNSKGMYNKKVVTWIIDFIGQHVMVGNRDLTMEEIDNIVKTICSAGEGIHGIKTQCKIIPQGGRPARRFQAPLKKSQSKP